MNEDQGWIVCAANDKIDTVRIIRHVTAPRPDLSFLCAAYRKTNRCMYARARARTKQWPFGPED